MSDTTSSDTASSGAATGPELSLSSDKICYIIAKAREFDVKDLPTVPDEASNASDDRMVEVLEDRPGEDAVLQELRSLIADMSEDEQIDLVALAWLGRGDAGVEGWQDLRDEAARAHNRRTAAYLLAMPLLPTYLQDGLDQLGLSCDDFERDNL
jgi:ribonuclease D